jgi:hypothetical protein
MAPIDILKPAEKNQTQTTNTPPCPTELNLINENRLHPVFPIWDISIPKGSQN